MHSAIGDEWNQIASFEHVMFLTLMNYSDDLEMETSCYY